MDYLVQFQLNIYALFILLILLWIIKEKIQVEYFGKNMLIHIIALTAAAVVTEALTWVFDGEQFFGAFFLEYSTNFMLVLFAPLLGGLMLSYVDYYIYGDQKRIRRRCYYMHFAVVTLIMLIVNLFTPIYFSINPETNIYSSGNLQWLHFVIILSMYIFMVIYVIYNRKKVNRHAAVIFLFFFALPIIGMLIQINNSKVFFSWTSIVLGILVTYIFLESTTGEKDYLTNLFSRQSYDRHIRALIEKKHSFAVALIDLDHFKAINDKYGHFEGDQLLIGFSRALENAFTDGEFIARLSGDEFMIVLAAGLSAEDINEAIYQRLFQSRDPLLKTLSFSLGYQEHKTGMSLDQLYTMADREMYKAKKHIKKPYENNGKKE